MRKFTLYVAAIVDGLILITGFAAPIIGIVYGLSNLPWCFALLLTPAVVAWPHVKLLKLCDRLNGTAAQK